MAKKISELTDGGAVQDTDEFVVARAGATYKIAGSEVAAIPSPITDPVLIETGADRPLDIESGPVGQLIRLNDPDADFGGGFYYADQGGGAGNEAAGWQYTSNGHGEAFFSASDDADDGLMSLGTSGGALIKVRSGTTGVILSVQVGSTVRFSVNADGSVAMAGLPTSDPAVAGHLWNNAGTLKVSAG